MEQEPRNRSATALAEGVFMMPFLGQQVYCEMPNYEVIVPALLKHGLYGLRQHAGLTPGIPVKPMLAKPTKGIAEARSIRSKL